jgi:alpha 1,3-glucosidase
MAYDPCTLVVALSAANTAAGQLFLDDTNSFDYQRGSFLLLRFTLSAEGVLRGEAANSGSGFVDANLLERVVLLGAEGRFTQATLVQGSNAAGQSVQQ